MSEEFKDLTENDLEDMIERLEARLREARSLLDGWVRLNRAWYGPENECPLEGATLVFLGTADQPSEGDKP